MKQVLLAAPISDTFKHTLLQNGFELIDYVVNDFDVTKITSLEGIITSNKLVLNQSFLSKCPTLKWIARLGSGMEIIDTAYCDLNNIKYFSSPNGIANSVAEHTTGMLLSLLHHIHTTHQEIKSGEWLREPNRGVELENQVVGIVGYGHTGSAFAQKLLAFTPHILAYDKYKSGFGNELIKEVNLEDIQREADIISFHIPLNQETTHIYNKDFLDSMKKNHILINVSRGAVADTNIIIDGLAAGKITGACLDVLEEEKNIPDLLSVQANNIQKLLNYNVLLTPHIAGYSHNAVEKMSAELYAQLETIL